jgi:hypothetical protein
MIHGGESQGGAVQTVEKRRALSAALCSAPVKISERESSEPTRIDFAGLIHVEAREDLSKKQIEKGALRIF